ncbi:MULTISPECIES: DMT family transporter [unclassified Staphylococcus]|uniref:DMT family transporter n=1 Tax=unclassified Staphylococcus TaxID=91994 RepID=UPI0021CE51B8|nr:MULTISPECIES: DMT family transporter [unclassified Staphylococcus]UXR78334.1 DMT family transporter [Staphylococcus sp. IVB6227]UXR82499.1 DMT family transporter [Staphylococcus sp. IVB6214]
MNRHQYTWTIYVAFGVTITLWASAFPVIKVALQDFEAVHLSTLRLVIASMMMLLIASIKKLSFPDVKDIPHILFLGFCGFAVYHTTLSIGEKYVSAGIASLLVSTTPIFSAILAACFLKDSFPMVAWIGSIIAFLGVALISLANDTSLTSLVWGILLILIASFSESIYFTFQKSLLEKYGFISLTIYTMIAGGLFMLVWLPGSLDDLQQAHINTVIALCYLGVGPTVIPYIALAYTIQKVGVSDATLSLYLTPVAALIISYILLGEIPTFFAIVGGIITLIGVVMTVARTT